MNKNKKQSLSKIKTPPSEWSVEELIENIKIYNLSYLKSNFRKNQINGKKFIKTKDLVDILKEDFSDDEEKEILNCQTELRKLEENFKKDDRKSSKNIQKQLIEPKYIHKISNLKLEESKTYLETINKTINSDSSQDNKKNNIKKNKTNYKEKNPKKYVNSDSSDINIEQHKNSKKPQIKRSDSSIEKSESSNKSSPQNNNIKKNNNNSDSDSSPIKINKNQGNKEQKQIIYTSSNSSNESDSPKPKNPISQTKPMKIRLPSSDSEKSSPEIKKYKNNEQMNMKNSKQNKKINEKMDFKNSKQKKNLDNSNSSESNSNEKINNNSNNFNKKKNEENIQDTVKMKPKPKVELDLDIKPLILISQKENKQYKIKKLCKIGRTVPDNDSNIILIDKDISREHCQIFLLQNGYYIRNNKTLNGTYIKLQSHYELKITDGMIFDIGCFYMRINSISEKGIKIGLCNDCDFETVENYVGYFKDKKKISFGKDPLKKENEILKISNLSSKEYGSFLKYSDEYFSFKIYDQTEIWHKISKKVNNDEICPFILLYPNMEIKLSEKTIFSVKDVGMKSLNSKCKNCSDIKNSLFYPCLHSIYCDSCGQNFINKKCEICKSKIESVEELIDITK